MATRLSLRSAKRRIATLEIEIERLNKLLERTNKRLQRAQIDRLTGLLRREGFEDMVSKEFLRSKRTKQPFAVCVVDLNNLKIINDKYGHPAGDMMIKSFAKVLQNAVREGDVIARVGGDEFMILLLGQDADSMDSARDRLLNEIAKQANSLKYFLGAAVGCASTTQGFSDFDSLYDAADVAMYEHKIMLKHGNLHA